MLQSWVSGFNSSNLAFSTWEMLRSPSTFSLWRINPVLTNYTNFTPVWIRTLNHSQNSKIIWRWEFYMLDLKFRFPLVLRDEDKYQLISRFTLNSSKYKLSLDFLTPILTFWTTRLVPWKPLVFLIELQDENFPFKSFLRHSSHCRNNTIITLSIFGNFAPTLGQRSWRLHRFTEGGVLSTKPPPHISL